MGDYDRDIARTGLEIGAVKLWPKDGPFLWASGFFMPIYNDNRRFLGDHEHRKMIAESMRADMWEQSLEFDMVAGTSTAGIAPAASLAQLLGKPLVIQEGSDVYRFDEHSLNFAELRMIHEDEIFYDIMVSTCPFAIPPAVMGANNANLPFAYVRQKKKDHGLGRQIEGIVRNGERALLVDYSIGAGYARDAKEALEHEGVTIGSSCTREISSMLEPADVTGKRILQVEDLVSTGGSYLKEIEVYRNKGATVTDCLAIFSYGLETALEKADAAGVNLHPQLTYPVLLEEAVAGGYVPDESRAALEDWRSAPFEWGAKHGYPPKKKE